MKEGIADDVRRSSKEGTAAFIEARRFSRVIGLSGLKLGLTVDRSITEPREKTVCEGAANVRRSKSVDRAVNAVRFESGIRS
jgi:hypothetical protein